MSDRLSALLQRFELSARVLHGGALRGVAPFDGGRGAGCLHLVRQGRLGVTDAQGHRTVLCEPSLLFLPRAGAHRLDADEVQGAEIVSAVVEFGIGDENPLMRALPAQLLVPLASLSGLDLAQRLLFGEAFGHRCGHDAVVNRLAEVLVIQLLRHAIEQRLVDGGLMAGLADPRLHKALCAVHAEPARGWSLESMAAEAGMSRARFAAHFANAPVITVEGRSYPVDVRWRPPVARPRRPAKAPSRARERSARRA